MVKFALGGQEKEKRVCELLKQAKTIREIAKIEPLSFTEIGRIKRKYFSLEDEDPKPSKRSQALKLIRQGKSDIDIAIELDLSAQEMLEYRQEYLTLNQQDDILRIYRAVGGDIWSFVTLYKEMKMEDILPDEAVLALSQNRSFKHMSEEYELLAKKLSPLRDADNLEKENVELVKENRKLSEIVGVFQEGLQSPFGQSKAPLTDDSWTRHVRRRRRANNSNYEVRELEDQDPRKFFENVP